MSKTTSKTSATEALDLTNLNQQILKISLPALGSLLAEPILTTTDSALIGHVGTAQLAGLAIGSTFLNAVVGLSIFLAYTTTAVTGRLLGAGKKKEALNLGIQIVWLGAILGTILAIIIMFCTRQISALLGASGIVQTYASLYLFYSAPGLIGMLIVLSATGLLRAMLDTKSPLIVSSLGAIFNIFLSATLIFGLDLGVIGSAIGTCVSQLLMAGGLGLIIRKKITPSELILFPNWKLISSCGLQGLPLVLRSAFLQGSLIVTTIVATKLGAANLASYQIVKTLWNVSAFSLDALAIAAQALVAQALGKNQVTLIRALIRRLNLWGVLLGILLAFCLGAFHSLWPLIFTTDPQVFQLTSLSLIAAACCQPLAALVYQYDGYLIGANDAKFLAAAQAISFLVYLPAVYLLSQAPFSASTAAVVLWLAYGLIFFGSRFLTLFIRSLGTKWMGIK